MKGIVRQTIYIFSGLIILTSVLVQTYTFATNNNLELINFLSLFTVQSNILAGIVFILTGIKNLQTFGKLRGLTTYSLVLTSLGYIILLGGKQDYLLSSVNLIVHYLAPTFALFAWLLDPPAASISFKQGLTWLLYPLLYFIYSMTRGLMTNWYPYDFIDPNKVGMETIAYNFGIILLGSIILISLLTIKNWKKH